jgi:uncharacterized glyoxalase superfamily protein PhnB
MIKNRSVPTDVLLPHLTYQRVGAAIEWLSRVFGFEEHYRYGGEPPNGAQMRLGKAWIMVNGPSERRRTPAATGVGTQSLTVFVEDVEAHYARTKKGGAQIVEELNETVYGELQYGVRDLEGHHWLFSRHAQDVAPEQWGAVRKGSMEV